MSSFPTHVSSIEHRLTREEVVPVPGCFIIPRRAFGAESDELAFRGLVEQFTSAHLEPMGS